MKLTTKGRYAVMAMADLARHSDGSPVALAEIADRQEISLSYLEQLFAKLRRGELVKSVRGPGGGYCCRAMPVTFGFPASSSRSTSRSRLRAASWGRRRAACRRPAAASPMICGKA